MTAKTSKSADEQFDRHIDRQILKISELERNLEGKIIDGFKVLKQTGEGEFFDAYEVYDNLGQTFALKLAKSTKYAPLFDAEAKLLSSLNHPQIPRALRAGEYGGKRFLAMDFTAETLQKRLADKGAYGFETALDIARKILAVLDYMHAKGIVHKDLSSKNIGFDKDNNLMLYNFNLSKNLIGRDLCYVVNDEFVNIGDVQTSILGGAEEYASPEQKKIKIDGKVHAVDNRSDLYAMGAVLYEMLTGNLPQGNYEKPSKKTDAPKCADAILDKALTPNPDNRYQTATEFIKDIEDGLEGKLKAESRVVKYFKKTAFPYLKRTMFPYFKGRMLPAVGNGVKKAGALAGKSIKTTGKCIWKTIKFPFWVYAFGPARYFDNQNNEGGVALTCLGTVVLWAATAIAPLVYHSSTSDKEFIDQFKKDPKGTIVYVDDDKIKYFRAKDALNESFYFKECTEIKKEIKNPLAEGELIYFTAKEDNKKQALYTLSLVTGEQKKIFDLDSAVNQVEKKILKEKYFDFEAGEGEFYELFTRKIAALNPSATAQEISSMVEDAKKDVLKRALAEYGLESTDKNIDELVPSREGDEKRFLLKIDNKWYSINDKGEDFKKESGAITNNTGKNPRICPHGTHGLDVGFDGWVQLEWSDDRFGSYNTIVKGSSLIWADCELEIGWDGERWGRHSFIGLKNTAEPKTAEEAEKK